MRWRKEREPSLISLRSLVLGEKQGRGGAGGTNVEACVEHEQEHDMESEVDDDDEDDEDSDGDGDSGGGGCGESSSLLCLVSG